MPKWKKILRKICRKTVRFFRTLCRKAGPALRRLSQRAGQWLRRFLRTCYRLGAPTCIFCGCVALFAVTALVLLITVPRAREAQAAANDVPAAADGMEPALSGATAVPAAAKKSWRTK